MMILEEKSKDPCRIIVLDEHPFVREGLKHYINCQPDLAVCFDTGQISSALEAAERLNAHLLMTEVRVAQGDVLEFIKTIRSRFPLMRILVLSQLEEDFYAERALRAGAHGYVMKHERTEEVLIAIRKVLKGELYVSRPIASCLLSKLLHAGTSGNPRRLDGLTDREFQVFHMLGAGLGSRQIAERLKLSVKTIETYRENIKRKFAFRTSAELLRHATHWLQSNQLPPQTVAVAGEIKTPPALTAA